MPETTERQLRSGRTRYHLLTTRCQAGSPVTFRDLAGTVVVRDIPNDVTNTHGRTDGGDPSDFDVTGRQGAFNSGEISVARLKRVRGLGTAT